MQLSEFGQRAQMVSGLMKSSKVTVVRERLPYVGRRKRAQIRTRKEFASVGEEEALRRLPTLRSLV